MSWLSVDGSAVVFIQRRQAPELREHVSRKEMTFEGSITIATNILQDSVALGYNICTEF